MAARRRITGSTLAPTASAPASLPVSSIAHNPRNPRPTDDDIAELAESVEQYGVLQSLGVVRYEIFLTRYPQHEAEIGAHEWVVLNGNRRLAAARAAGLAEVPVRALDHLGRDDAFDEAALIENIHRKALPPLREAGAIAELVERHGSQAAAAKRLNKSKAFVSYRLALLQLVPELQEALTTGELSVEDARDLGRLPAAEQLSAWRPAISVHGVNADAARPGGVHAVNAETAPPVRRERRARAVALAVGDPVKVAAQLREHFDPDGLAAIVQLLQPHVR